jgi:dynein heavy chain, axonemal
LFNNASLVEETGSKKADIEVIRNEILKYHNAAEEIQRISNDFMNYPMFRVEAAKIKDKLFTSATNIRSQLLEELSAWCLNTVEHIENTYEEMAVRISTVPQNEKELVNIREFIKISKEKTTVELTEDLKNVTKHQELLDEFSYTYKTEDIERTLDLKMKPMQIGSVIQDGNSDILQKEEEFCQRLDQEKDDFAKTLLEFDERFQQIIKFNSIDQI